MSWGGGGEGGDNSNTFKQSFDIWGEWHTIKLSLGIQYLQLIVLRQAQKFKTVVSLNSDLESELSILLTYSWVFLYNLHLDF